ncbi:hypothetical protein D8674_030231 [Pyrus ussuriensis x Pyrus communis]|uniref:Uncharacterized protein n=1 Tax=Pyrus ussuriensis x Pyrus communis TaxID=2448454 RepID=A0A5N5EXQ2_9ROSA|nr:hypothetical protein D8674_030231 [Pyrus ussuriensis x Pyrus communis]
MDLLGVAGRRPGLPMVVCCSSRDELDAVRSAVANVPYISLTSLLMVSKVVIYEACDNLFGRRWESNQHGRWGEVVTLKSIEESSNLVIAEMHINISEIL